MGRWKDNGQGQAYYDANDSGPDQIAAPPLSTPSGQTPGQYGGTARPGYHIEWSGGVTGGAHEVPDNPSDPRTPPLTGKDLFQQSPDLVKGPQFPGYNPGPYDPNAPKYGFNDPKPPPGTPRPEMPMINPSFLAPGQDGSWQMDGGQGSTIEQILTALQAKFGGSPGVMGKVAGAITAQPQSQSALQRAATAIQARRAQPSGGSLLAAVPRAGGMALGSLGSLFGR